MGKLENGCTDSVYSLQSQARNSKCPEWLKQFSGHPGNNSNVLMPIQMLVRYQESHMRCGARSDNAQGELKIPRTRNIQSLLY